MKDEHKNGKKMARNGCNTVIYKETFVSNHSLLESFLSNSVFAPSHEPLIWTEGLEEKLQPRLKLRIFQNPFFLLM